MDLPTNIVLDQLPGPIRSSFPANHFWNELIDSPNRNYFALAYSIAEASMNNQAGCILLGRRVGTAGEVLHNMTKVLACCWRSPWCRWLEEDVFLFMAQRYTNHHFAVALVLGHMTAGFQVVPGTHVAEGWIDRDVSYDNEKWIPWDEVTLAKRIAAT